MPDRERTIINDLGRIVVSPVCRPMDLHLQWNAGKFMTDADRAMVSKFVIPGLDASLCKCDRCKELHPDGIWWVDMSMRIQIAEDKAARRKKAAKL